MTNDHQKVDFDAYADDYESLLQDQLAFFSNDRGYFSNHKAAIASTLFDQPPPRILDFGCGIGLSLPYLNRYFPQSELFATDVSEKSLEHVRRTHGFATVLNNQDVDGLTFDLIFIAGVFHHIAPGERNAVIRRLKNLLSNDGKLCIFDHNPYNPVTQRMVSTCPFDEDAVLLTRQEMCGLLTQQAGLTVHAKRYCLFFPEPLKALTPLEKLLGWLPLGGQYYVVAGR